MISKAILVLSAMAILCFTTKAMDSDDNSSIWRHSLWHDKMGDPDSYNKSSILRDAIDWHDKDQVIKEVTRFNYYDTSSTIWKDVGELVNDKDVVIALLKRHADTESTAEDCDWILKKIPRALQVDRDVLVATLYRSKLNYERIPVDMQCDEEVISAMLSLRVGICHPSEMLQYESLKENCNHLNIFDDKARFMSSGIKSQMFQLLSDRLKHDADVVKTALEDDLDFGYVPEFMRENPDILLTAMIGSPEDASEIAKLNKTAGHIFDLFSQMPEAVGLGNVGLNECFEKFGPRGESIPTGNMSFRIEDKYGLSGTMFEKYGRVTFQFANPNCVFRNIKLLNAEQLLAFVQVPHVLLDLIHNIGEKYISGKKNVHKSLLRRGNRDIVYRVPGVELPFGENRLKDVIIQPEPEHEIEELQPEV